MYHYSDDGHKPMSLGAKVLVFDDGHSYEATINECIIDSNGDLFYQLELDTPEDTVGIFVCILFMWSLNISPDIFSGTIGAISFHILPAKLPPHTTFRILLGRWHLKNGSMTAMQPN